MLVLRPYQLPINPTRDRVNKLLSGRGFLLGREPWARDPKIILKRWAEEAPVFEKVAAYGEFAVVRIFIHYVSEDPESDFDETTGKTIVKWTPHRLSRIVTLWIPLSRTKINFLLSVGEIEESDVKLLITEMIEGLNEDAIRGREFDFPKVRELNNHGWMHGCQNRPGVIQRGTLFGDFNFDEHTELDEFLDNPIGTESNQEGIVVNGNRKVRVLRYGKFQLMGIPKERFYDNPKRAMVMEECFGVGLELLNACKN